MGLHRGLPQQLGTAGEGAEELVVEVVAVGEDYDSGVLQGRLEHQLPGEEHHGEALARALGVPHHPAPAVPALARGLQRGPHRLLHRVELVVGGQLLLHLLAVVLVDDEVADQLEQPLFGEDPAQEDLEGVVLRRSQPLAVNGLPGQEAFLGGIQRSQAGLQPV